MKKYVKTVFVLTVIGLLVFLLLHSRQAGEGVRRGLTLSFSAVLPALFPAMVLSGLVGELAECLPMPPAVTVWLTSHLCGFPLGIRTLTLAYERGLLTKHQATRLTFSCANASPAFLIAFAGEAVFESKRLGVLLFCGQLTVSFLLLIFSGALKKPLCCLPTERPLIPILTRSISAAANGSLQITAYITVFSVIAVLLEKFKVFQKVYGFLELTGGLAALPQDAIFLGGAMVGFSGLSVFLQNTSYLTEVKISPFPMLLGKCIYGMWIPLFLLFFANL